MENLSSTAPINVMGGSTEPACDNYYAENNCLSDDLGCCLWNMDDLWQLKQSQERCTQIWSWNNPSKANLSFIGMIRYFLSRVIFFFTQHTRWGRLNVEYRFRQKDFTDDLEIPFELWTLSRESKNPVTHVGCLFCIMCIK